MAKKKGAKGVKGAKEENILRDRVILAATIVVMAPILFVIIQNARHSFSIQMQINALNREARDYQKQIERDSLLLENIKSDEGLEQYARETFYMQRKGERVFIIKD